MDKEKETESTDEFFNQLREVSLPLIKFLNERYHPHVTAIVTPTSVEIMEGIAYIPKIYDFVKD